jgi:hypothetical protein
METNPVILVLAVLAVLAVLYVLARLFLPPRLLDALAGRIKAD